MSLGVGTGTGCAAEVSTGVSVEVGGAVFFDLFFFGAVLVHSVLFRPVLDEEPFCFWKTLLLVLRLGLASTAEHLVRILGLPLHQTSSLCLFRKLDTSSLD